MFKHQWFDLYLHTDDELGDLLNTSIVKRETLHEWPLSCVQQIVTADGQQWVYKTQREPTVESQFYAGVQSDLLVETKTLYTQAEHVILLFEYVDAPLLESLSLTADETIKIGRDVQQQMGMIEADCPILFDVSSRDKWEQMAQWTLDNLRYLVDDGSLTYVTTDALVALKPHVLSPTVLDAASHNSGLVHGDFTGENLFVLPDKKYKLIDWSRPFRGNTDIDLATLLESAGYDPLAYVEKPILTMHAMLRINWLTQCATRWFTPGIATYDQQITDLITRII